MELKGLIKYSLTEKLEEFNIFIFKNNNTLLIYHDTSNGNEGNFDS